MVWRVVGLVLSVVVIGLVVVSAWWLIALVRETLSGWFWGLVAAGVVLAGVLVAALSVLGAWVLDGRRR